MKIALVTDAWGPKQVNGVVTTLTNLVAEVRIRGHEVKVINPSSYKTYSLPFYPEIDLVISTKKAISDLIEYKPDAIHIATEGPLGLAVSKFCVKNGIKYTTSYHTEWVEFVRSFFPLVPKNIVTYFLKKVHKHSSSILTTNSEMKNKLVSRGYKQVNVWSRGVNTNLFNPSRRKKIYDINMPIFLYVGRVSPEKNLPDFFNMDVRGLKVVVGDGPLLETYKLIYPEVEFVGMKQGVELAEYYASADVFVFPSKSDTFGVVMIEALASGIPVAAYPVTGPNEIIINETNGYLSDNLAQAANECLSIPKINCVNSVRKWTWENTADIFLDNLVTSKM